jgi:hypothetical protein
VSKRIVTLLIFGLLFFGLLLVVGLSFHWYHTGSKPEQPIEFPHNVHVGKLEMECTDCHQYADRSPHAGIPAMSVCMDCHESAATDREEIKKLTEYWNKKEPIPWVKVHRQPWHVVFTHKRHIQAGIDCTTCHGNVEAMTTVRKVRSLEMGWCVSCHRRNEAPTDCLTCHK